MSTKNSKGAIQELASADEEPTAQNVRDVRELALGIELERGAALEADDVDLVCVAWHRAVRSREALLLDHARRCGLTLGPVAPRTCDEPCDRFVEHLERASATVAGWPEWKRTILGGRL